jgi:hypothetical protein
VLQSNGPFDQYVIALRRGFVAAQAKLEPIIIQRFSEFCLSHLEELVNEDSSFSSAITKLLNPDPKNRPYSLPYQIFPSSDDSKSTFRIPDRIMKMFAENLPYGSGQTPNSYSDWVGDNGLEIFYPRIFHRFFTLWSVSPLPSTWSEIYYFEMTVGPGSVFNAVNGRYSPRLLVNPRPPTY